MQEKNPSKNFILNDLPIAEAHCDGPCGVYDPSSARIAAEAVRSMTKKILDLTPPEPGDTQAVASSWVMTRGLTFGLLGFTFRTLPAVSLED